MPPAAAPSGIALQEALRRQDAQRAHEGIRVSGERRSEHRGVRNPHLGSGIKQWFYSEQTAEWATGQRLPSNDYEIE